MMERVDETPPPIVWLNFRYARIEALLGLALALRR